MPPETKDSILGTTKKILGLAESYTIFDLDVITHINTVMTTLEQLGVGPVGGFRVEGYGETWEAYLGADPKWSLVKSYIYLRVKLLFDQPTTSFAITSLEKQISEMEWRLTVTS